MGVVLPAEAHLVVIDREQSMVGDRDAMGVTCQVLQNVLGPAKRGLGLHDPLLPEQGAQESRKRLLLRQGEADSLKHELVSLEGSP
jgi:hypothetical protein